MADPVLTAALNDLKAAIASAQDTLSNTDRNHFARQLGNLKKQVSAPAIAVAEEQFAALIGKEIAKSEALMERLQVAKAVAHLDAEHAHALAAKAKRKRTAYELAGGRMDGKTMDGSDETPKL